MSIPAPFDHFRRTHFTPAQLADPNFSGPAADPDQDGYTNLVEHFFAMDPTVPGKSPSYQSELVEDGDSIYCEFHFRYSLDAVDVTFKLEVSPDSTVWSSATGHYELINSFDHADRTRTLVYRSQLSEQPREFFRLALTAE